jgi:rifampicin phosphotransferase
MDHTLLVPLIHPLDPSQYGTKAARLAEIADLGARVVPGLVVSAKAHAAALREAATGEPPRVPEDLAEALRGPLDELGPAPWVVRTSSWTEDLPGASAAGMFRSELGLRNFAGVVAAMERCWRAAHAERVAVYLQATNQGQSPPPLPSVAILIQRQIRALWAGVLFTRDPTQGANSDQLRCELVRGSTTAVTAGLLDPNAHCLDRGGRSRPPLPSNASTTARDLVALADLAEQTVSGPADVELALTKEGPVVLQVRPITAYGSTGAHRRGDEPSGDDLSWRWDAEHNPAPLSPLHASLVARLDRIPSLPYHMRCVGGFLYFATRPGVGAPVEESPNQVRRAWPKRRFLLEKRLLELERLGTEEGASLETLLSTFDGFYERYAALAGAPFAGSHRRLATRMDDDLARGAVTRDHLHEALAGVATPLTKALTGLARQAVANPPALVEALAEGRDVSTVPGGAALESELASVILRLGALPPVWDIAVPTLAESPAALRRTVATLARTCGQTTAPPGGPSTEPVDPHLINLAADEEDDLLFARGLAVLRNACLRAGAHLVGADRLDHPEDVFRLELAPLVRALASEPKERPGLKPALRTLLTPDPGDPPNEPKGPSGPSQSKARQQVLTGFGSGAGTVQAQALVVRRLTGRFEDLADAARGRIVVCPSLLPSAVVLLAGAAGIVTDHGGLLSHGAILARELGLPAVLGTRAATTHLVTGDLLWLDANQGLVIRM